MNEEKPINSMNLKVSQSAEIAFIDAGKEAVKRLAESNLKKKKLFKI